MTTFCTYCSAEKKRSQEELPAVQRYGSPRINSVYSAALSLGLEFLIFSGEYGILEPSEPIPYYAHLLIAPEVPDHAKKIADQLKALGVKDLIFFTRPLEEDKNLKPYLDCIQLASLGAGIELKIVEIGTSNV
jgi:hypothetical protein